MLRIWHPWDKWECYRGGFYASVAPGGLAKEETLKMYADFLKDSPRFRRATRRVISSWPTSCEQFLSNQGINRIAWMGQASMCIETGTPSTFRAGFKLLTDKQQAKANAIAQEAIEIWEKNIYPQMRLPL